jgi:hypothetical protein
VILDSKHIQSDLNSIAFTVLFLYGRGRHHFLYEERNSEHKTFGGRIGSQVKKIVEASIHFTRKTLPFMQVCFVKLVFNV